MVVVVVAPDLGRVRFARPRKLRTPAPNAQQQKVSRSRIAEHEIIPRAGEERPRVGCGRLLCVVRAVYPVAPPRRRGSSRHCPRAAPPAARKHRIKLAVPTESFQFKLHIFVQRQQATKRPEQARSQGSGMRLLLRTLARLDWRLAKLAVASQGSEGRRTPCARVSRRPSPRNAEHVQNAV